VPPLLFREANQGGQDVHITIRGILWSSLVGLTVWAYAITALWLWNPAHRTNTTNILAFPPNPYSGSVPVSLVMLGMFLYGGFYQLLFFIPRKCGIPGEDGGPWMSLRVYLAAMLAGVIFFRFVDEFCWFQFRRSNKRNNEEKL